MVNLHGAYKPTGIRRTYPNLMTREAVLGLEYCKFSDKITSTHNVTLPFTRMVIGPMDYTPGGFNNVKEKYFKVQNKKPLAPTTRCQQLAMFVVYDSPLQMVCDYPGAYRNERESEFIREVPASWDKTYPIKGEIGNYIILARKKGTKWFLGGITDTTARSFSIPLNFLEKDSTYNTTIYEDHKLTPKYPKAVNIRKTSLTNVDTIQIKMAANGGFAGIIQKK
jgi:alpha-glucosidase